MSYNTRLTEECPLTKEKSYKYRLCAYCGNGLKFIVVCFVALTIAITTMLVLQILYTESIPQSSLYGVHGAVATDYANCSQIGTKMLARLGNAVDAAVAATICMAVVAPHKTSLGGGGYMMIYNYKNYTPAIVVDFASNITTGFFAEVGIRLPALLKGLEFTQKSYGNLPWRDVVEPVAELAREGFVISKDLADEVAKNTDYEIFYAGPLNPGDKLQLPELARTLDIIAHYGAMALYNGTLSHEILQNTTRHERLLQQLASYEPAVTIAKNSTLHRHTIYYPSHAPFMQEVIEELEKLPILVENASTVESQVLVALTLRFKHMFQELSQNVQHNIKKETYTGVMAMDWQDTYVTVLSGLSSPFGRGNRMAGFFLDNIDNNDLSTFVPIIFHDDEGICGLRGVFGSNDVFLNAQILYNLIVRALNVSAAIEYPRYYFTSDGMEIENNQRYSMEAALQTQFYLPLMSASSHDVSLSSMRSVNAIVKRKDSLSSHSDSRGNGIASRF